MDFGFILETLPTLIKTLPLTLYIFFISAFFGFLLAVLVAAIRIVKVPVLHQLFAVYASFMRSTPGIIHIFVVYYGLPVLLSNFGININNIDRMVFSVIALVYITELLFRKFYDLAI